MISREQQGKLRGRALGKRQHLRLTVEEVREPIHGYPLSVSRHLVALLAMNDDLVADSLAWLPSLVDAHQLRGPSRRSYQRVPQLPRRV